MMTFVVLSCLVEAFSTLMFAAAIVMGIREIILYFRDVPFLFKKKSLNRQP